ncbi:AMP-binding enzyme family protein-like protein [Mollisia scopiformis]|uniref:AMP-binding enzyme family protein-like protein n=1 Tax=Mollisia scopiformis TaxID=149040 RepID=A0A194XHM9_MOLSC|nr:AMP-binding enzyme family protein-like protein [Mollisia scopiformis]KUJ19720.1 AMP-binding enzyme family protein-like protein [Mollisia scopiformis]
MSECHGEVLTDLDQSMWDMFYSTAMKYPQREAVTNMGTKVRAFRLLDRISPSSHEEVVFQWSYEELLSAVETISAWLQESRCCEGEYLVTFVWNSAEWVIFFWAAARLKMPFIPLDPRTLEQTADEYILRLRPSVIVVQDEAAAATLESVSSHFKGSKARISCTTSPSKSWTSLSTLSNNRSRASPFKNAPSPGEDLALIVFTSGTTATPKGCCHTAANLWSESYDFDPDKDPNMVEKWLVHTPVSHVFAVNNALRSFRYGGTVVFASKTFDIHASLKALELYQCTRMSAVPTLVQGLLSLPAFPGKERLALHYMSLGGTLIKAEDIQMCKRLGSDAVMQVYGMSEGAPTLSWLRDDPLLASGHYPGVGKVLPGSRIRICAPVSREVVKRNIPGELRMGGTSVISGYLDGADPEAFYTDEYGSWLKTGDQAVLDDNGVVQLLGRYKDLIIRGGENISPAKIEECLGQIPGVLAQVVGVPDNIAGEVPVAVVQSLMSRTKAEIMHLVQPLGQSYSLAAIVTLEELGIEKYPLTSAGKVRKNVLKELLVKYFEPEPEPEPESRTNKSKTIRQLIEIWATLVVNSPSKDDSVYDFADSISLLRYCDKVWRALGKKLYLQDFVKHETIEKQAQLLQSRGESTAEAESPLVLSATELNRTKDGPPGIADMAHTNGDPQRFIETRMATSKAIEKLELSWDNDVEDVIPIKDLFYGVVDGPRPQSYRHRIAFRVDGKSPEIIRGALEKGFASRPLFRALLVKLSDNTPVHVVIRPGSSLFKLLITEKQCDEKATQEIILDDSGASFSRLQMVQAVIAHSKDSTTLILSYNHSVFDAMSMVPWMRDLDLLIGDPNITLLSATPFKLFADMAYSHRESMPATLDVQYFVKRLSGISKQTKAFWPPQRAPGWMIGRDVDSEHGEARIKSRKAEPIRYPRVWIKSKVPHLAALKAKNIQPYIVVKTAIALFNVLKTDQEYAILTTIDAGRSWPFMPAWIPLPPAMSIDGPTIEWTANMLRILPDETVEHLLERIQKDQEELSLHAHAPMFRVMDELGVEGPFVQDAMMRQTFNWDISLQYLKSGNSYGDVDLTSMKLIDRVDWPDCGFFWEAGMLSADELCVLATWDDAQLSLEEAEGHVASLNKIIQWITQPDHLFRPVGELLEGRWD